MRKVLSAFRAEPRLVSEPEQDSETGGPKPEPLKPFPKNYTVKYLTTEHQVNSQLRGIVEGAVGFDTEFTERRPTAEEQIIIDYFPHAPGPRKAAMTGLQIAQLHSKDGFEVEWDYVGIRLVQLAYGDAAWVIDLRAIKGLPKELDRIMRSADIAKVGVGLVKDLAVVWDDLRMEMRKLVDVGMMAKLVMAEKYPKIGYGNMSLKTSAEDILGYRLQKELAQSDWAASDLTDEQIEYAALDAVASLRLHEALTEALDQKSVEIGCPIPGAWYTFNTKAGEPTRVKRGADGTEINWKTSDCTWFAGGRFQGYP
ncbi:ribonuclease H-like domain-containing protein [Mycena filopes]|nr:ribonuclease H-like domain-containing protein [Mycena filopes]